METVVIDCKKPSGDVCPGSEVVARVGLLLTDSSKCITAGLSVSEVKSCWWGGTKPALQATVYRLPMYEKP